MSRLKVHHNPDFPMGRGRAALNRRLRGAFEAFSHWFWRSWFEAFPTGTPPDGPGSPPLRADAAILSEGALLSEDVDAVSKHRLR